MLEARVWEQPSRPPLSSVRISAIIRHYQAAAPNACFDSRSRRHTTPSFCTQSPNWVTSSVSILRSSRDLDARHQNIQLLLRPSYNASILPSRHRGCHLCRRTSFRCPDVGENWRGSWQQRNNTTGDDQHHHCVLLHCRCLHVACRSAAGHHMLLVWSPLSIILTSAGRTHKPSPCSLWKRQWQKCTYFCIWIQPKGDSDDLWTVLKPTVLKPTRKTDNYTLFVWKWSTRSDLFHEASLPQVWGIRSKVRRLSQSLTESEPWCWVRRFSFWLDIKI